MSVSENSKPKILVVLTGGTICSSTDARGKRYSNGKAARIIEAFSCGASPFRTQAELVSLMPTDILSENMTVDTWNTILDCFRTEVRWEEYRGAILLHGTDTLAYTAALLSVCLAGVPVPVCLVSSQLPLDHEGTNGHANFRAAVELIMNGIAPNVYAVYRNSDGILYAHYGAHLLQCANHSDDFFSADAMVIPDPRNACLSGIPFETDGICLNKMHELTSCVLRLTPYVGIDYGAFDLEGVRAVVHGTFHTGAVCVERKNGRGEYSRYSILHLMDRCRERGIPLFLAPCSPEAYQYESTGDILAHGASHIRGMTNEMAYVKTLVGCALGLRGEELAAFVNAAINHEVVY